jgi:hypothetical protein
MSDQEETGIGAILDLEELFLSREFGRRPARSTWGASATVESQPAHLEQLFLSEVFGHPEVVAGATQAVTVAPAASARHTLVLLRGGGAGSSARDSPRAKAIAAVSGVAAAILAATGLASTTGQGPGRPPVTEQAQGTPGPANESRSGVAGPTAVPSQSGTGSSGGGGAGATLTAFSPVAAVVPRGATGDGAATPPAAPAPSNGGPTPGLPPGGGGSMLTPALGVAGHEVSSVGSSVTAMSGTLGKALLVASVVQALGTVTTSAANNVGGGIPPNVLGAI